MKPKKIKGAVWDSMLVWGKAMLNARREAANFDELVLRARQSVAKVYGANSRTPGCLF